jgi:prepilin-type N-terminal cleavage/methylation domain-containing protein
MQYRDQQGFSLIELLLVVVIVGIIAALAIPSLQKAVVAAENSSTFSLMRTISSAQLNYFTQNGRFGRLAEINNSSNNNLGTIAGDRMVRGKFTFEMTPLVPTDDQLRSQFLITATRADGLIYEYEVNQTGQIVQVLP